MNDEQDRSRSETLTANERVKAVSGLFMNLAAGLLVAAVARAYVAGLDRPALLWICGVVLLILVALKLLRLLDDEEGS